MIYGIDLGTTNSIIGYNGELYSGLVKSSVNLDTNEQSDDLTVKGAFCAYKKNMNAGIAGKEPVHASSIILDKLVKIANEKTGQNIKDICVSVPAAFTPYQRAAVYMAAEKVGLTVKGIIDEPTAACIAAGIEEKNLYLVIDIGGGTSDFSIVDNTSGVYKVKSKNGEMVGGDDIDFYLVDKLLDLLNVPVLQRSKELRYKFKVEVEKFKCEVKEGQDYVVDFTPYGYSKVKLSYQDLEEAVENILEPTIDCVINTISDAKINNAELKVIFVGGSTKGKVVTDFYKRYITLNFVELENLDKDLAVAIGVSKFAKMVEEGTINKVIKPISPRLSIGDSDGNTIQIIKLGSKLPASGVYPVTNSSKTRYLELNIYSGDSLVVDNCQLEGSLNVDMGREYEAGEMQCEVSLMLDEFGCLKVTVENIINGNIYEDVLEIK